jgi:hypothetical protein
LILNKLLILKGALNCQNAGKSRVKYATSARNLRRISFVFGRFDLSPDLQAGTSVEVIFFQGILETWSTSDLPTIRQEPGKTADGRAER